MRRKLAVLAAGIAAVAAASAAALAVAPGETAFPSAEIKDVFVATNQVNSAGIQSNYFARGSTVKFEVFAGKVGTKQVLTADDVRYAFIKIPGQPNVKLSYTAPTKRNGPNFTGTWTVPATMATGRLVYTTRFQTKDKKFGNFVQIPVDSSILTIVG